MWKTKLRRCIYTSPSGFKVYQNLVYRWLTFGSSAIQTLINRLYPHKPALSYLPALTLMARHYPGATCVLGLGGAGIAFLLDPMPLTIIEKNEEVIDIAKRFFGIEALKGLRVIQDHAKIYMQHTAECYTHLIVDLYDAHHFPKDCADEEFFSLCKKRLSEEGILAVNLANRKEQEIIFQFIKNQFPHTLVIPVKKSANLVILASKSDSKESFLNKINTTRELKKIMWVNYWGCVGEYKKLCS